MSEAKGSQFPVFSVFIINKAGGLIYNRDFSSSVPKLNSNDYLTLASTFHSLHAITGRGIQSPQSALTLSPEHAAAMANNGITCLEARDFRLQCYQTLTGIKFLVTAHPSHQTLDKLLQSIYLLYTDYVLKNPFYELDMPIRMEQFDAQMAKLINQR